MEEVFIRTWTLPEWLAKKYFKDKDFYSIDELIGIIEDLDADLDMLKDEYEEYKEYVKSNFKELTYQEQVE